MEFKTIGKLGASLVERVFLQDLKNTDHEEVDSVLNVLYSPKQNYDRETKDNLGQN